MARIRTIKPDFWEDERAGRLSILARLSFVGLISLADDEGRGRAAPEWLIRRLHPYAAIRLGTFRRSLAEVEGTGMVRFYNVNGERFYHVKNFTKHQLINRALPSKLPPPPSEALHEDSRRDHGALTEDSRGKGMERSGTEVERSGMDHRGERAWPVSLEAPPASAREPEDPISMDEARQIEGLPREPPRPASPRKFTAEELAERKRQVKASLGVVEPESSR